MSAPLAAQLRALIYLLEQQQDDTAHEKLFWEFLAAVHPGEVEQLHGQQMTLLQDLYGDEFQAWHVARMEADEGPEGLIWRMAHGKL